MIDLTKNWKTRDGQQVFLLEPKTIGGELLGMITAKSWSAWAIWRPDTGECMGLERKSDLDLVIDEGEPRAPSVSQTIWRPAESAPKDGTVILAWFPNMDWPEAIRWDEYPEDAKEEYGEGYWTYADVLLRGALGHVHCTPTHWTPITKPEGVE